LTVSSVKAVSIKPHPYAEKASDRSIDRELIDPQDYNQKGKNIQAGHCHDSNDDY
jgi:hypothetical protein